MKEELPRNEEVIFDRQISLVVDNQGNTENKQRRYVRAGWLIFWLLLALVSLCLWLMRLLGVLNLLPA